MGVGTEIKCWFVKPTHPQFTCTKKGWRRKKVRPKIQQNQLHLAHKHK